MRSLNKTLKVNLIILSLVFPVSLCLTGYIWGFLIYSTAAAVIFAIVGLIFGILLNFACFYRKIFAIAIYQAPIPSIMFLLFWFLSNIFVNDLFAFFFAIGGLIIGLWLNVELVLPYRFYKIKKRILALVYFSYSLGLLGFFLGIPVFNILLGVLAGNYLSIRVINNFRKDKEIHINLQQGAAFTALVLFIIILISALFVWADMENYIDLTQKLLRIQLTPNSFKILILSGGLFIVVLQYFITLFTAKTMLQLWQYRRNQRISKK